MASLLLGLLSWQCACSLLLPSAKVQIRSKRVLNKVETTLKVPLNTWENSGLIHKIEAHEINYFGHMFDIESSKVSSDTMYLTGYYDIDEDILLALLHQQDGSFQQVNSLSFSLWFDDLQASPLLSFTNVPVIPKKFFARSCEGVLKLFYPIWQPPPEIAHV